jgi:hypothetical protein
MREGKLILVRTPKIHKMILVVRRARFDISSAHEDLSLWANKLNKPGSVLWPRSGDIFGPGLSRRRHNVQETKGGLASQVGLDTVADPTEWKAGFIVGAAVWHTRDVLWFLMVIGGRWFDGMVFIHRLHLVRAHTRSI